MDTEHARLRRRGELERTRWPSALLEQLHLQPVRQPHPVHRARHRRRGSDTTDTYTYPAPTDAHPHAVQAVTHTGGAPGASYGYDPAGHTTTRAGQSLTYDAEGHLAAITTGTDTQHRIYDADGDLLLQTDSTDSVLTSATPRSTPTASGDSARSAPTPPPG